MNCQLCQKELDAHQEGILPEGIRTQVEAHLESCINCAQSYQLIRIADKVMDEEKSMQSNPFLVTRIMSGIEELEQNRESLLHIPVYQKMVKTLLVSVSMAAAIFIGVVAGSNYTPTKPANSLPIEMTYMNDAALESVELFSTL